NVLVAGGTGSTNFPTRTPLQGANAGSGDAFVAKVVPNPPVTGPLAYTARSGNGLDALTLRLRVSGLGNIVEVLNNGMLVAAKLLANTTVVQITGAANEADTLTIDNAFGGPLQIAGGISFNGGSGGNNSLVILGTAAADTLLLTQGSATFNSVEAVNYSNV